MPACAQPGRPECPPPPPTPLTWGSDYPTRVWNSVLVPYLFGLHDFGEGVDASDLALDRLKVRLIHQVGLVDDHGVSEGELLDCLVYRGCFLRLPFQLRQNVLCVH